MKRGSSFCLFSCCLALCFAASAAYGSPVLYTFTGTTLGTSGSPSHAQVFQLTVPDFLPVVLNGPVIPFLSTDPAVNSCVPCNSPPIPALHFLRGADSDLIQFHDEDNTNYLYSFAENTFSNAGTYHTLPGINVNTGTLTISEVPEPSTVGVLIIGLSTIAFGLRLRSVRVLHG